MARNMTFRLGEREVENFDWTSLFITLFLITLGLMSVYSATISYAESFFYKQVIAASLGFLLLIGVVFIPHKTIINSSYWIYIISICLLIAVLAFGVTIHGTKGWISMGGFSLQPAEFAKLGALLALSKFYSKKGRDVRNIRDLLQSLMLISPLLILILLQPDVGTSSVIFIIFIGVLYWIGFNIFYLYFLIILPVIVIVSLLDSTLFYVITGVFSFGAFLFRKNIILTFIFVAILFSFGYLGPKVYDGLAPHQKSRIDSFLDPSSDPRGSGYNVMQAKLAVGSGGLTGKGFKQGTITQLRYVPEQWTDFIYSVPTEELGFVGGASVILLFLGLIYRATKIAYENEKPFYSILAFGIGTAFTYHVIINIGMVIGLVPVMGIPLPFMSYGGTSMLLNLILVALLLNAHKNQKIN